MTNAYISIIYTFFLYMWFLIELFDQAYTYARVLFLFASVPVSGKLVSLTSSWYVVCMYMYLCVTLNECMCTYICVCINKIFETSLFI